MSEEQKPEKGITSRISLWVGLVGAALAIILGVMTLFDRAYPKDAALSAEGSSHDFVIPEKYVSALEAAEIAAYNKDKQGYTSFKGAIAVFVIEITNNGEKEATDINLESETSGYYRLVKTGQQPTNGSYNKVIPIGSMRPSHTVKEQMWTGGSMGYYGLNQIRVTQPNNKPIRVKTAKTPDLESAWFDIRISTIFYTIGAVCFIAIATSFVIDSMYTRKYYMQKINPPVKEG